MERGVTPPELVEADDQSPADEDDSDDGEPYHNFNRAMAVAS